MDTSILIASCAILTVASGVYVLLPLFRESESSLDIELMAETDIDRLMDRKAAIYGNLKDLMLEYRMGRLSEEDFRQLEDGYKKDAALILQKLDELQVLEDMEESVVKATDSQKISPGKKESVNYPVKCPSCGSDLIPGKKFCADCGYKIVISNQ